MFAARGPIIFQATQNTTPANLDYLINMLLIAGGGGAGSGGGGGGGGYGSNTTTDALGGAGGSGVVILRILTADYSGITTGSPTVTTTGSYTILTYTASGSYTA